MSNDALQLRRDRDLGQVITDSFQYYKLNWKLLLKALAFGSLPFFLVGGFFLNSFFQTIMSSALAGVEPNAFTLNMGLGYLFMAFGGLMYVAIIQEHIKANLDGTLAHTEAGTLVSNAFRNSPTYFLIGLLAGILVFAGLMLFMIPGIWLAISFILANACHGMERSGATGSLQRSFNLVKGNWWNTFGVLFLLGLIVGVLAYAVMIPFYMMLGLGLASGATMDPEAGGSAILGMMPLMFAVMGLAYMLLYPIPLIGATLQYFSLVERKERRSLGDAVDRFDTL